MTGKFTDETGDQLTPSLAVKRGRRHCYYVSRRLIANSGECDLSGWRLPAAMLETAVATLIRNTLDDPAAPAHLIIAATPSEVVRVRETTKHLAKLLAGPGRRGVLMRLVASERIAPGKLSISLDRGMLAELLESPADRIAAAALTIEGGFILLRRGVGAKIVLDGAAPEIDEKLLRNLARGWSWFEEIKRGATMHGIASREGVSQRRVAQLVDISFLAPDTVDAIVAGRQPMRLTTDMLMKSPHLPLWKDQRAMIAAL